MILISLKSHGSHCGKTFSVWEYSMGKMWGERGRKEEERCQEMNLWD